MLAGPLPMPLEARLDTASEVFLGQIIQITEAPEVSASQGVRMGRATARVATVLKGASATTLEFVVVTWVGPEYQGAQTLQARRVGDSGIWLLNGSGKEARVIDFLPAERKADVQRMLELLAHRKWSQPLNGLQAWAAVVQPDYHHPNPVIIFAVRNATASAIYVPNHAQAGFVSATVVNHAGQSQEYTLGQVGVGASTVFCEKLEPGAITYLHPDYSFIDLAWRQKLAPGHYSVTLKCQNERAGESAATVSQRVPVSPWKGELSAPPVQLLVPAK